jgi:hypothetical protein
VKCEDVKSEGSANHFTLYILRLTFHLFHIPSHVHNKLKLNAKVNQTNGRSKQSPERLGNFTQNKG